MKFQVMAASLALGVAIALLPGAAGAQSTPAEQLPVPSAALLKTLGPGGLAQNSTIKPGPRPKITGESRYRKRLKANPGRWSHSKLKFRYRWFRDGKAIRGKGTTRQVRKMTYQDVGHRMSVKAIGMRPKHRQVASPMSQRTRPVRHLRDPNRTVTYRVAFNGAKLNRAKTYKRVAKIYADARGWRKAGVKFRRVKRGGNFTVVMAKAERMRNYSSACSPKWSCRVGRYVIINEDRWRSSTRSWRGARKSIRSYRHMVVNHETGHWFGRGHSGCPRRGAKAPLMMQQSKGLGGCRANPFPLDSEARAVAR